MVEEIRVGDWISWPGTLGRDQGKVISVGDNTYKVQTRKGDTPVYTTIPKGGGAERIAPPDET